MKQSKKLVCLIMSVVMLAFVVCGCSSSEDNNANSQSQSKYAPVTDEEKEISNRIQNAQSSDELHDIEYDDIIELNIYNVKNEDDVNATLRYINLWVDLYEKKATFVEDGRLLYDNEMVRSLSELDFRTTILKQIDCGDLVNEAYQEFSDRMYNSFLQNGNRVQLSIDNEDYNVIDLIAEATDDIASGDDLAAGIISKYEAKEFIRYSKEFEKCYKLLADKYIEIVDEGDIIGSVSDMSSISSHMSGSLEKWLEAVDEIKINANEEALSLLDAELPNINTNIQGIQDSIVAKIDEGSANIDSVRQGLLESMN